jgi:uncharacterized surface protein with fasciclin (FAS1) repeats
MVRFLSLFILLISSVGYGQEPVKRPIDDPDLKTFVEAGKAAGLQDIFQGTGPFTFFIPSNAAFEKFGRYKLQELMKPQNNDRLVTLLIYHVVPGKYLAQTLKTMELPTISGRSLNISVENGEIRVNGAKVIRSDMVGPNGVVHEIDAVLVP